MTSRLLFSLFIWLFSGWMVIPHDADASRREYAIPEITVQARIEPSGVIHLTESRTYRFQGSFSWADYGLPRRGFDEVRNIRVSEGDQWYINDDSGEPGTFTVSTSDNELVILWNYEAQDTQRTFTLHYELAGALADGPDWTEFYWNWLASGREKATERFTLSLQLPGVQTESIHVWTRLPEERHTVQVDNGTVHLQARDLSVRQSVITRVLFPTAWLETGALNGVTPELTLESVLEEEAARIDQQHKRQERLNWYRERAPLFNLGIILASLGFFVLIYRRLGKRYRPTQSELQPLGVLPGPLSPALAGPLISSGMVQPVHMLACIFDLARRGWLKVRQEDTGKKKKWYRSDTTVFVLEKAASIPQDPLLLFEKHLLKHLYEKMQAGETRLDKLFKKESDSSEKWYQDWEKLVKEEIKAQQWTDKAGTKAMWQHAAGQMPLFLLALFMLIRGGPPMIPALVITGIMLLATLFLYRRTKAGEIAYQRWMAYYKSLRKQDPGALAGGSPDQHFIYATAFGIPSKGISRLLDLAGKDEIHPAFIWFVLVPGMTRTPSQIAESLSTLHSTGTTTFTTSVSGSGASAGSAGGGARGGAG